MKWGLGAVKRNPNGKATSALRPKDTGTEEMSYEDIQRESALG